MKFFIYITYIFFTHSLFSQQNQDKWEKVTTGQNGHTFYVDMSNIKEKKNDIFFWQLINYVKKDEYGDLSAKILTKANCITYKLKWIKISYHKEYMAKDHVILKKPSTTVSGWQLPHRLSASKKVLEYVCNNKGTLL